MRGQERKAVPAQAENHQNKYQILQLHSCPERLVKESGSLSQKPHWLLHIEMLGQTPLCSLPNQMSHAPGSLTSWGFCGHQSFTSIVSFLWTQCRESDCHTLPVLSGFGDFDSSLCDSFTFPSIMSEKLVSDREHCQVLLSAG